MMGRFSKLAVILIIVALTAVTAAAPASGAVFIFSNSSPITINDAAAATPYPSNITVSGVTGVITHVTVRFFGLSQSQFSLDIDALVVAPASFHAVMLMSDTGASSGISNANLTFDDCALRLLPRNTQVVSGRYRPSNHSFANSETLPAPAPVEPYGTALAAFNGLSGSNVNGTWSLYVRDQFPIGSGSIGGGWSITIITDTGLPSGLNPVPCGKPDFDGDGRADNVVYQQATGNWFVVGSAAGFFSPALNFGGPGFIPVAGDYDGDGITDPAVYNTSNGNWFILGSTQGFFNVLNFGGPGFTPMPADYDGDGETDPAVYQPSTGNWFVVGSTDGFFSLLNFGGAGFTPVPAAQ